MSSGVKLLFENDFYKLSKDYQRIEQTILYLDQHFREQPTLSDLAKNVYLSEYHFHRLFKRWAGITPKQFLKFLTIEYAKNHLDKSQSILDTTYNLGLSSISRLHDLFITVDAVTPGEFKKKGQGLIIFYGVHPTPFGKCVLSVTDRGICGLSFITENNVKNSIKNLMEEWNGAKFIEDTNITGDYLDKIFIRSCNDDRPKLNLFLKGTNMQIKVWQALLNVPPTNVISYQDFNEYLGSDEGFKNIDKALMTNPIAYLIPCHRLIHSMGVFGTYKWGTARKRAILGWETVNSNSSINQCNTIEFSDNYSDHYKEEKIR